MLYFYTGGALWWAIYMICTGHLNATYYWLLILYLHYSRCMCLWTYITKVDTHNNHVPVTVKSLWPVDVYISLC